MKFPSRRFSPSTLIVPKSLRHADREVHASLTCILLHLAVAEKFLDAVDPLAFELCKYLVLRPAVFYQNGQSDMSLPVLRTHVRGLRWTHVLS